MRILSSDHTFNSTYPAPHFRPLVPFLKMDDLYDEYATQIARNLQPGKADFESGSETTSAKLILKRNQIPAPRQPMPTSLTMTKRKM
jgi:hypothetical protein